MSNVPQSPSGFTWGQIWPVAKILIGVGVVGLAFYGALRLSGQATAPPSGAVPAATPPTAGASTDSAGGGASRAQPAPQAAGTSVVPNPATGGFAQGKKQAQTFVSLPASSPPQTVSRVKEIAISPRDWNFYGIRSRSEWTVATEKEGWLPPEADTALPDVVHLEAGTVYRVKAVSCLPSGTTLWMVSPPASDPQARAKAYTAEQLAGGVHLYTPKEAVLLLKWGKQSGCAGTATFIVDGLTEPADAMRKRFQFEDLE